MSRPRSESIPILIWPGADTNLISKPEKSQEKLNLIIPSRDRVSSEIVIAGHVELNRHSL